MILDQEKKKTLMRKKLLKYKVVVELIMVDQFLILTIASSVCEIFLGEIFDGGILDDLDEESRSTIKMFFENNLNVSETSRQLFIHRNTLVYRIEKLEKITGLDLRNFDDAVTFRIALMVENYLKYMKEKD